MITIRLVVKEKFKVSVTVIKYGSENDINTIFYKYDLLHLRHIRADVWAGKSTIICISWEGLYYIHYEKSTLYLRV